MQISSITKLTDTQKFMVKRVDAQMEKIQKELDALKAELQKHMEKPNAIRGEIVELKKTLVPFAIVRASICNAQSREKYFSEISKKQFDEMVTKKYGGQ